MVLRPAASPAFGTADLSNCEREQIHFAASIQPFGALLVMREPRLEIVQSSVGAVEILGVQGELIGRTLADLGGDLAQCLRPHLADDLKAIPRAVRCKIGNGKREREFDCLIHRPPGGGLIVELETAGPKVDLSRHVEQALPLISSASTLQTLCDETARIMKSLTGYDRVMVYRFDEKGHGEVCSEQREPHLEPFLGNRYPSSDIPQIARQLYIKNRVRVLVDVEYSPTPLSPVLSPITGQDLDMSLCFLRSMSPIHIQYLKNMGVGATLVVSLVVGGKLWGLIACHHYAPKFVHFEMRAVCEVLAEVIGTRIAALESFMRAQAELSVRRLEQRMIDAISRDGDWRGALFDKAQSLLLPVHAAGAALLCEGQILTTGEVPGTQELRDLRDWLDTHNTAPMFSTCSLGIDEPTFKSLTAVASGVAAVRLSGSPGEYLIWFRPEQIRKVTWAGDPQKPMVIGSDPADLSPRRSFAQWHQMVMGTSEPWTPADLGAARLIGDSVSDVVLQFRAVRMLIAQDQLESVRSQVEKSGQPVLVTNHQGAVLLANDALQALLGNDNARPERIEDLALYFRDPSAVRRRLKEMIAQKRTWRGEVHLETNSGEAVPLLVRGDPVFSAPDRVLGYVLIFIDLTERKAAEAARRHLQDGLIERHRISSVRLDSQDDIEFQNLLSAVVANAQLAALEITDRVDTANMPELLESVRASLMRTAAVLEQLIWHASKSTKKDKD